MSKQPRSKKFSKHLPRITQEGKGCITGFIPDDWMVAHKNFNYQPCCQDPRNWEGIGKIAHLTSQDPWYFKGYRWWRSVACSCGAGVIATEYLLSPDCSISERPWMRLFV